MHTVQVADPSHTAHPDHSLCGQDAADAASVATAHAAARTGTGAGSTGRTWPRADNAHRLRSGRCGRRGHVVMCVRMRMRDVIVAGVTHRSVPCQRVAGRLNGRDDGASAEDVGQLIGLDAEVERLCKTEGHASSKCVKVVFWLNAQR